MQMGEITSRQEVGETKIINEIHFHQEKHGA